MKAKPWTEKELQYLKENYHKLSNINIAKALGRSRKAVETKARKLGLKKPLTCRICTERKPIETSVLLSYFGVFWKENGRNIR